MITENGEGSVTYGTNSAYTGTTYTTVNMDKDVEEKSYLAGDHIVLLAACDGGDCWKDSIPINHVYELEKQSWTRRAGGIYIKLDIQGEPNEWIPMEGFESDKNGLLNFRRATEEEVALYKELGTPYHIADYDRLVRPKEDLGFIADLFGKLNIE